MVRKKKLTFHQKIQHRLRKHFHRHVHGLLHITNYVHHFLFHGLELVVICLITASFGFTNLTGLTDNFYTNNDTETAEHLLYAMQNPATSLKKGNIISVRTMDMDIENTFAKGYCTYGAARISPEFFPYIDEYTQQRTWGGNAIDRCKNASDTGYKIGSIPTQGALVVYDAGGRFGSYGHVGKVLHYDRSLKKIIVRDMAWVGRGKMSDRREDLTTANIKCYIYNKKTEVPTIEIPEVQTGIVVPNTGTTSATTGEPIISPSTIHSAPTTTPPTTVSTTPPTPTLPHTQPTVPDLIVPTTPSIPVNTQETINKELSLELNDLSDIAKHFVTQNDITITVTYSSPLTLGELANVKIEIHDKKTGNKYLGLLPFSFSLLSTNDMLQPNISNIKLINDGSMDIAILAQKAGTATIVITMDGTKISEFTVGVK